VIFSVVYTQSTNTNSTSFKMIIYGASSNDGVTALPAEVLEEIFSYVSDEDIINAANANLQWNSVCQRIARQRCAQKIPQDILTEILSEQEWGVVDWVEVWRCWVTCQLHTDTCHSWPDAQQQYTRIIKLPSQVTSTAIDGSLVYSGSDDGVLELRDINQENCVIRGNIQDGKVNSISLLKCFNIVLVAGESSLHFLRPDFVSRSWQRLRSDFMMTLGTNKHLSVFGPRFSAADSQSVVNVFEIFYVGQIVRTSLICAVKQEQQKWVQWKLWREKLIGMNSNGEILVYSLLSHFGELMYKSEPYTVVLYKNPSWIFRDVVFCSTLASRGLTNSNYGPHTYVYMSDRWGERNGTGYWMVGPVDDLSDKVFLEDNILDIDTMISSYRPTNQFEKIMRGFCLKKIYPGLSTSDDVTCICLKRRLLLCGTNAGSLLVFSADELDSDSASRHSKLDCETKPLAKMKISLEPIVKVDLGFADNEILLYYKTYTEDLSCISLSSQFSFSS